MKSVGTALKSHLAQHWQTMATCVLILREDAVQFAFTDHDTDLAISGWAAPWNRLHATYRAAAAIGSKAVTTADALNVDNTKGLGVFTDDAITDEDLLAGLYDNARVTIFQVNWADLTMTPLVQRSGWIGNVSSGRFTFDAEFLGLMKLYTASLCELTSVACRAELGDGRCKVNLVPFTHSGTLTGVGADNATLYDTARTEPGPGGGVAITSITNANPGVVTMADASLHLANGQPIVISGVGGMATVNGQTIARNPSGATFQLGVDTSDTGDYPPYTSGGTVTPLGGTAGYFDFGNITFDSGLNAGRTFPIQAYVPGQFSLYMPLPKLAAVGDEYTAVAGCDKSKATCIDKFDNILNRRAEDFMVGTDKMIQVGRG
jgi:uncharacterized phage protein (TIGR02218 family)